MDVTRTSFTRKSEADAHMRARVQATFGTGVAFEVAKMACVGITAGWVVTEWPPRPVDPRVAEWVRHQRAMQGTF